MMDMAVSERSNIQISGNIILEHQEASTTLKETGINKEGVYTEEKREVKFEDGQYYVVPIVEPQTSLFD